MNYGKKLNKKKQKNKKTYLSSMPRIAWARHVFNAYNHVKKGEKVYDENGNLIGIVDGGYARCTAKTPGTVFLGGKKFVSGDVEKYQDGWKKV